MHAEAVGDERHANQQDEGQSQHLDRRVAGDEVADRPRRQHHDADGDDIGGDHHGKEGSHADGGDDGIESENEIDDHDERDDAEEIGRIARSRAFFAALHFLMDLSRALIEQEQAAPDQDDVAPGEIEIPNRENRSGEPGDPDEQRQHKNAQAQGAQKADLLGNWALGRG